MCLQLLAGPPASSGSLGEVRRHTSDGDQRCVTLIPNLDTMAPCTQCNAGSIKFGVTFVPEGETEGTVVVEPATVDGSEYRKVRNELW